MRDRVHDASSFRRGRRWLRALTLVAALATLAVSSSSAGAQRPRGVGRPRAPGAARRGRRRPRCRCETQLDLHGAFETGTTSSLNAWGGGLAMRTTFGRFADRLRIALAPGVDYVHQQRTGAGLTTLAIDLDVQPGGLEVITPYVGGSVGGTWSSAGQWTGGRLMLGTQAGALVSLGRSRVRLKAEERFGYVNGQEHVLATRLGMLFSF